MPSPAREVAKAPARTRLAAASGTLASRFSRAFGAGDGTVIGGRISLAIDPGALSRLAAGHATALVSGTNGKTTTNCLLAAALGSAGPVVSNSGGSNLPSGLVAALSAPKLGPRATAALEVDEAYLGKVAAATRPRAVVVLNLTRDQLDRVSEVRMLGRRWRAALGALEGAHVVANADDAMVAWAAREARSVTWVAAGQAWKGDSTGCPQCEGRIVFGDCDWSCPSCGLARPDPDMWLEGDEMVARNGTRTAFELSIPGSFNRANAAMAASAAAAMGVPVAEGLSAMAATADVAGRYEVVEVGGVKVRLLLAKNPAGWVGIFELLAPPPSPVVVAINARVADGRDPSWLWDVPFENLRGRPVVACGERASDLAVRLGYAEVDHTVLRDPLQAVGSVREGQADFVANYTAFQDLRAALRRRAR